MRTFHGFLTHGFPNCMHMGMTQTGFAANFTYLLEEQAQHVAHLVSQVKEREAKSIEPTREAEEGRVKLVTGPTVMTQYHNPCTPGASHCPGTEPATGLSPNHLSG